MNDNELITRSNERVSSFFKSLDRMVAGLERLAKTCKPILGGERYLTDKEVSARLKLSRRTLQDYRDQGRIPYCQLGGKILYRESDIEKVLAENYRDAFR
ncbi:MAG: helix-turn-helix domain-containing protein [Tannerellaceae bacterium]|jgi:excisionase family DNA binding protein|nr:helix-turn-helix domain-containing protein [Tannerellaceae bacterium]